MTQVDDLEMDHWALIIIHNPMCINTLHLPGFSHRLCGSRTRPAVDLAATPLDGLAGVVARFIPAAVFTGVGERQRVFTPWVTFCAFLGQSLQRGASCREAVRRVQAWCLTEGRSAPDDNTAAYYQARARLPLDCLRKAHARLVGWLDSAAPAERWQGRVVKLIDGCGYSMPDTRANRAVYPYAGCRQPGCGFPTAKLVGLFSLATGHLVRCAHASWKTHEVPLARQLVGWMNPGDVVVADRGFCGWGLIALLQRKGVDVVMRLHQARAEGLGKTEWRRPQKPETWDRALWHELPRQLAVRIVRFQVVTAGFRTKTVTLVTTLLDEVAYPDSALAELYGKRWQIEGNFRDLKTTLGLDVLRTHSPALIEREVLVQGIAYNLVRALMLEASRIHSVPLARLSFKGAQTTLRQWSGLLTASQRSPSRLSRCYGDLLLALAADLLPIRPNRSEPRCVKRRPKTYQLMTKPRRFMRVSPSRNLKK